MTLSNAQWAPSGAGGGAEGPPPGVQTQGHWLGPPEARLLGWLTTPAGRGSRSGVVIAPPLGYSYWSAHRTLRVLAERLAAAGHVVLRFDYESTGDSAGDQWEPARVEAWRRSLAAASAELRRLGSEQLTVIGVQLGATFALLDAGDLGADAIVAWAPVVSGRRYAREIRARSLAVPGERLPGAIEGAMVLAGTVFTAETLAALATLDATQVRMPTATRTLLVGDPGPPELAAALASLGGEVDRRAIAGGETALEWASEDAVVPESIVEAICVWLGTIDPDRPLPAGCAQARIDWGGSPLSERVVAIGDERLVGILTAPAEPTGPGPMTVVFLNTGSETHTGPGRAWVEYARELARAGYQCLRVDYRGWGESPDGGYAPGRPYDPHCEDDTISIVRALRGLGIERVALVGLCASAWMALRAVRREPVAAVVALNPQMYWRMGDPVEALLQDTRARRTPERRRQERAARLGVWSALDRIGQRPWAGRWLDELGSARTPVTLVFAENDDGIEFLRTRLNRRLRLVTRSGGIRLVEVAEIDHSMHRAWLRPAIVEVLKRELSAAAEGP